MIFSFSHLLIFPSSQPPILLSPHLLILTAVAVKKRKQHKFKIIFIISRRWTQIHADKTKKRFKKWQFMRNKNLFSRRWTQMHADKTKNFKMAISEK